jgi:hypothetical protein
MNPHVKLTKPVGIILLVCTIGYAACSHSGSTPASQLILGKWTPDSSTDYESNNTNYTYDTTYKYTGNSYATFTADGHVYSFSGTYYDTATYSFINSSQLRWQQISSRSTSPPIILTIQVLTSGKLELYSSGVDSGYTPPATFTGVDYYHR